MFPKGIITERMQQRERRELICFVIFCLYNCSHDVRAEEIQS